jgi:hypothetical protein
MGFTSVRARIPDIPAETPIQDDGVGGRRVRVISHTRVGTGDKAADIRVEASSAWDARKGALRVSSGNLSSRVLVDVVATPRTPCPEPATVATLMPHAQLSVLE